MYVEGSQINQDEHLNYQVEVNEDEGEEFESEEEEMNSQEEGQGR